jgi:GWxTD domain-containing protein
MRLAPICTTACLVSTFLATTTVARAAEPLTQEDRIWLASVDPIILGEERDIFQDIGSAEREAFREIFWARRDPDPEGPKPDNTFRREYSARVETANQRFRVLGRTGVESDCGYVFLVLGEPASTTRAGGTISIGPRAPEDWTYRGERFAKGETQVSFDEDCSLPNRGGEFKQQLAPVIEALVTRPSLGYTIGDDGHLVTLAAQLPKPNAARGLIDDPRQDFLLEAETKLTMRTPEGATFIGGLLHGDASKLTQHDVDGTPRVDLVIALEANGADGKPAQAGKLEVTADVAPDGSFTAAWPLTVPAGVYTVRLGVIDPASQLGSVTNLVFEVPDLGSSEMIASPPVLFGELVQGVTPGPKDPYAALTLGTNRLVTHFGNVFNTSDELQAVSFLYNAALDPETGKAILAATFEVKDAERQVLTRSEEQVFDAAQAVAGVGPVLLATFAPGTYSLELTVRDDVAKTKQVIVTDFVVTADSTAAGDAAPEAQE